MRSIFISVFLLLVLLVGLAAFIGCSTKTQVCTITPINIEELKADNRDLDGEIAKVSERLAQVQAEFAAKQATRDERAAVPPQLKLELRRLKQASGVTEEIIEEPTEEPDQAQSDEIQVRPKNSP